MIHARILNHTHCIGLKQGYKGLWVRRSAIVDPVSKANTHLQETAWTPTPYELDLLNRGASVHVKLLTNGHPPIKVDVGGLPDEVA